jgi:hypothetical protein
MNSTIRSIYLLSSILIVAGILHVLTTNQTIVYISAPLVIATTITWTLPGRLTEMVILAVLVELLSTAPLGVMTATVMLPYIIYRLRGRISVSPSLSFLFLILLTTLIQVSITAAPALMTLISQSINITLPITFFWIIQILITILTTSVASYAISLTFQYLLPLQQSNIVSLESRRI